MTYFRERRGILLLSLLSPLIFLGVFALYGLPVGAFLYGLLLYIMVWAVYWTAGCYAFVKDHEKREMLKRSLLNGDTELPAPRSLTEADHAEMLEILCGRIRELTDTTAQEKREAQDYYSLWVHQIKTPIAALRMLLQTQDVPCSAAMEAELFRVEQYAEMALGYIRLENSPNDLCFRECGLDGIIRGSIRRFAPVFIAKKLRLCYEGTDLTVLTDEKWLSFLLEQLLSNAAKYTQAGQVTVSVTGETVSVEDTGIGIAEEDLPRIFEKGFTGQNGRLDHRATGLGLYLCRRTAELLGITLSVRSAAGQGSVFTLDLARDRQRPD